MVELNLKGLKKVDRYDKEIAVVELQKELGEYYNDIIELEWDMSVDEFVAMFWNQEEECFDI